MLCQLEYSTLNFLPSNFSTCLLAKLTMGYCTVMSCLFHSVLKWIWIKSQRDWCPKFATDKWPFSKHLLPSFWHLHEYLYKTEVQMVILRCWTGLYINWFKSYETKHKYFRFCFFAILLKKTDLCYVFCIFCFFLASLHFLHLCHNFWTNEDIDLFGTSKWPSEPESVKESQKTARNGAKAEICQLQILGISLYIVLAQT